MNAGAWIALAIAVLVAAMIAEAWLKRGRRRSPISRYAKAPERELVTEALDLETVEAARNSERVRMNSPDAGRVGNTIPLPRKITDKEAYARFWVPRNSKQDKRR